MVSVFYLAESAQKKHSQVGFFNNTPIFFSFFVGFGSSRGAWAGIWCVWAHPLFRYSGPEKICVSAVILSVNSLLCTVQDRSASAASETGEGEGEKVGGKVGERVGVVGEGVGERLGEEVGEEVGGGGRGRP